MSQTEQFHNTIRYWLSVGRTLASGNGPLSTYFEYFNVLLSLY
jgi:hypothetical protein